ncbi:MAG TPA: hypothetical protein VH165_34250 [Kofleriaceae bacterium]|jgi:hypothetical protein|nr:hypothetical protein [Kofleriaceae bacterium]
MLDRSFVVVLALVAACKPPDVTFTSDNIDLLFLIDDSPSMADKQNNLAASFPQFIDILSTLPGGLPNLHIAVVTSDLGSQGADDPAPGPAIGSEGRCSGFGKAGLMQLFGAPVVTGERFLSDIKDPAKLDGSRIRNYTGALSDAFSKMVKAGDDGCGFEQHLEAVKQALEPANTPNAGFLRPDAYLAVIIIADEDDCSMSHSSLIADDLASIATLGPLESFRCTRFGVLCDDGGATTDAMNQAGTKTQCHSNDHSAYLTKVGDYATFFKSLKADPQKVIVADLGGPPDPFATELRAPVESAMEIPALAHSCTYIGGDGKPEVADPAVRIKSFLNGFPNRSRFASICELSGGLQQIGDLLQTTIGGDIEAKLADVEPNTPGLQ